MEIDTTINDQRWENCGLDVYLVMKDTLSNILKILKAPEHITEVSVVLCDDAFIQTLNNEYRGKNKPTNVLSFPQLDEDSIGLDIPGMLEESSLGDIIVSFDTVEQEAKEQAKPLEDHFKHMFLHGMLHLLGYDHIEPDEAEEMEALEIEILSCMGIKNPYSDTEIVA